MIIAASAPLVITAQAHIIAYKCIGCHAPLLPEQVLASQACCFWPATGKQHDAGYRRTLARVACGHILRAAQLEVVQWILANQMQLVDGLVRLCIKQPCNVVTSRSATAIDDFVSCCSQSSMLIRYLPVLFHRCDELQRSMPVSYRR